MKLIILDPSREQFERLCVEFDIQPQRQAQVPVQVIPGVTMMMHMQVIPDDSAMATWIALNHADWIGDTWKQINQVLHRDREAHANGQH